MRFLRWIAGFAVALAVAFFLAFNRAPVPVHWNPLSPAATLPFYIPALAILLFGFLLGALSVWLNTDPLHFERRKQKKRVASLEKELQTLQGQVRPGGADEFFPSLPVLMKKKRR